MGAQTNRRRGSRSLTDEQMREVRRLYFAERMKQRQIAALFLISRPLVSCVVCDAPAGVRWDLVKPMDAAKYPRQPKPEKPAARAAAVRGDVGKCPICGKWRIHHTGSNCSAVLKKLYGRINESVA